MKDGKSMPKMVQLVESRNYEGKTALMIAIEHERNDIANYLMDNFPLIDLEKKDSINGNSALHIACLKENLNMASKIYTARPRLCLKQNYEGQTPFHIAASKRNL